MKILINLMIFLVCVSCVTACNSLGEKSGVLNCCSKTVVNGHCSENVNFIIHPEKIDIKASPYTDIIVNMTVVNQENSVGILTFNGLKEVVLNPREKRTVNLPFKTSAKGLAEDFDLLVEMEFNNGVTSAKTIPVSIESVYIKKVNWWQKVLKFVRDFL